MKRNEQMASITTFDAHGNQDGLFARVHRAWNDYRLYRRTLGELESMSNRELRDLGISRYSIRQVAYDSVYGA